MLFPAPRDLEPAPFCKVLLNPRCVGTLLLLDSAGMALERTWCLLEITLTLDLPKDSRLFPPSATALSCMYFVELGWEGCREQKSSYTHCLRVMLSSWCWRWRQLSSHPMLGSVML